MTPTEAQITDLRKSDPYLTLREIGERVGRTKERVRQILKGVGLPTSRPSMREKCRQCGKIAWPGGHRVDRLCGSCGYESRSIMVSCHHCNATKRVTQGDIDKHNKPPYNSRFYCNRVCFVSRIGGGFGRTCKFNIGDVAVFTSQTHYSLHEGHVVSIRETSSGKSSRQYVVGCECGQTLRPLAPFLATVS